MEHYRFSERSLTNLKGVHPDLVKVVHLALHLSKYDFGIGEGLRSIDRQKDLLRRKKTWTLDSYHLVQPDGYGHAIDFNVYINGRYSDDIKHYRKVLKSFFKAAIHLGVQIEAGGLWESVVDGPHIQIVPKLK